MNSWKRPFDPKFDSVIYRQIVDFAQHNGIILRGHFLDELEIFARDVEVVFERHLAEELHKPPQPITVDGKTWIYVGPKR